MNVNALTTVQAEKFNSLDGFILTNVMHGNATIMLENRDILSPRRIWRKIRAYVPSQSFHPSNRYGITPQQVMELCDSAQATLKLWQADGYPVDEYGNIEIKSNRGPFSGPPLIMPGMTTMQMFLGVKK